MPKEEWGVKRVCLTTGKRFYDLNKNPIVSPYTGETLEVEAGTSRMIAADAEDVASVKARESSSDDDIALEDDLLDDDDDDDDDEGDNVSLDDIKDMSSEDED